MGPVIAKVERKQLLAVEEAMIDFEYTYTRPAPGDILDVAPYPGWTAEAGFGGLTHHPSDETIRGAVYKLNDSSELYYPDTSL